LSCHGDDVLARGRGGEAGLVEMVGAFDGECMAVVGTGFRRTRFVVGRVWEGRRDGIVLVDNSIVLRGIRWFLCLCSLCSMAYKAWIVNKEHQNDRVGLEECPE
jgi:hypothetical protein